ncbi:MAG: TetR/AcrR family transcriptional regulator [Dysgonamonadaceae bacterium]|jgi:AcrR family transcriptional regulator|nr:TetR/AcrR family transcriptional regulator [Dysgonamonadaceae bacterium]
MANEKKTRIRRTRDVIDNQLMSAVCRVINELGFSQLGINSVSEVAKVEKAYIYRNFESFDNLLERYFIRNDFWERFIVQKAYNEHGSDLKEMFIYYLTELYKTMDQNREFESIARWEIAEPTPYILRHARRRELDNQKFMEKNVEHFKGSDIDIEAIYALLISGIYYLNMHKNVSTFSNIDFTTREGKRRLIKTIEQLAGVLFK